MDSVLCVCDGLAFEAAEGHVAQLLREQLAISDVCLLNKRRGA